MTRKPKKNEPKKTAAKKTPQPAKKRTKKAATKKRAKKQVKQKKTPPPRTPEEEDSLDDQLRTGLVNVMELEDLVPPRMLLDPPSDALIEGICQSVLLGAPLEEACRAVGIDYRTVKRWVETGVTSMISGIGDQFAKFVRAADAAEAQSIIRDLGSIKMGARHGNTLLDLLGRRFPKKFGAKSQHTVTGIFESVQLPEPIQVREPEFNGRLLAIIQEAGMDNPDNFTPEQE